MKLYSDSGGTAPSPRRARMYIAEKGLNIPIEPLALHEDNRTPEFQKKNPLGTLPVLELADGTCLAESIAICRYLEALYPDPPLFGADPLEVGTVEMWNRRAEFAFYLPIEYAGGFMGEEVAEKSRRRVFRTMAVFDAALAAQPFVAGDKFTVADITVKVAFDFGVAYNGFEQHTEYEHFNRWFAEVAARPSGDA